MVFEKPGLTLVELGRRSFPERRRLGDKRREISAEQIVQITKLFETFEEGEHSKVSMKRTAGKPLLMKET